MKTYKIHLLRHGLTEANLSGIYLGNKTDIPLCFEGKRQLSDIQHRGELPVIQKVYSSPLLRAAQSAGLLYPGFEPCLIEELCEYDFGEFEGKTAQELENDPRYLEWTSGKSDRAPGGESGADFVKRLALGLNEVVRDMMSEKITNAAVIMHGGAITMLLAACAVPRRRPVEWTCEPGHGFSVRVTPSYYHSSGVVEVYGEL